jgi:hypothetical protein
MVAWVIAASIGLMLFFWLLPKAVRWSILLSSWIAELPTGWMILLFIVFPPVFLVFLFAMGIHQLGLSEKILTYTAPKNSANDADRILKGYEK